MSSKTTNYNLHKIDLTDAPPDITVLNSNFDTIDQVLKTLDEKETSSADGVSATLSTSWTEQPDGSYSQGVTVGGVTTDCECVVDCALTGNDIDADCAVLEAWSCVNRATQSTNRITFYCYTDKPTVSIPISVVILK